MRLTLHKKKGALLFYWQAWVEGHRLWIQQGEVGARGACDAMPFKPERSLAEVLTAASREPLADGFAERLPEDHPILTLVAPDEKSLPTDLVDRIRVALEQTGILLAPPLAPPDPAAPPAFSVVDGNLATRITRDALGLRTDIEVSITP